MTVRNHTIFTGSDYVFKTSLEMGSRLRVSSDRLWETGIELGTPWYKVYPLHRSGGVIFFFMVVPWH